MVQPQGLSFSGSHYSHLSIHLQWHHPESPIDVTLKWHLIPKYTFGIWLSVFYFSLSLAHLSWAWSTVNWILRPSLWLYCFTVLVDFMSIMQHMLVESKASGEWLRSEAFSCGIELSQWENDDSGGGTMWNCPQHLKIKQPHSAGWNKRDKLPLNVRLCYSGVTPARVPQREASDKRLEETKRGLQYGWRAAGYTAY